MGLKELETIKKELSTIKEVESRELFVFSNVLTLSFICRLSILLKERLAHNDTKDKSSTEILRIMDYIQNNLGHKLSIKEIAEYGNMSTATLNRRFRETLTISPMEYVINCRVQRAKELLEQKGLTKAEIAQTCGFYDSVHMNKCFAKFERN